MSKIILGIDPGTATTGFGVILEEKNQVKYVDCGYITTTPKDNPADRLLIISKAMEELIKKYKPQLASVESLFFAKNKTTAIAVAQARGVVLATLAKYRVEIEEYTPLQVKQALTGYGRADKTQMQKMVKNILSLDKIPRPDDSADALAIAICSAYNLKPMLK